MNDFSRSAIQTDDFLFAPEAPANDDGRAAAPPAPAASPAAEGCNGARAVPANWRAARHGCSWQPGTWPEPF